MNILVTGGLGFIGSNFIKYVINKKEVDIVINIDTITKTSSAANKKNAESFENHAKYKFYDFWLDVLDYAPSKKEFERILKEYNITHIVHFAAESHVDNSISDPRRFVQSNILGTFNLLEIIRDFPEIRFHHISTDEVYGSLGEEGKFVETTPYAPNSPYSASKASADLICRSYYITHKFDVVVTRCSNNYGPYQFPEKLIPRFVTNLIDDLKVPIYGNGLNVRDWLHVDDHCRGIELVTEKGRVGEVYNIGGGTELSNLQLTKKILNKLGKDESYIQYVEDRLGHDFRYSLNSKKITD